MLEMNSDPEWLRKRAEEEAQSGGVYVPLTVSCPSCLGRSVADDWKVNPVVAMVSCPICRRWMSVREIVNGQLSK